MDPTDLRILALLQTDASLSNQELTERVQVLPETRLPPPTSSPLPEASNGAQRRENRAALAFVILFGLGLGLAAAIVLESALAASAAGKLRVFIGKTTSRILLREGHAFEFWLRNWLAFTFYCSMSALMLGMGGSMWKKDSPRLVFVLLFLLGGLLMFLCAPAFLLLEFFF